MLAELVRAQRRPAVSVTLVHVDLNDLGNSTSTAIDGAILQPESPGPQNVDQAQPVYLSGAFDLPGVHLAEAGDVVIVDGGAEWQVLSDGIVWLDRTRVPVAAGTMPERVSLREPGGEPGGWNEGDHRTEVTPFEPFATDVPARVQAIGGTPTSEPEVAGDVVTVAGYRVSIPVTTEDLDQIVVDGETNTLIDVISSPDPLLVGRTLRVQDLVRGSHRFERTLLCTLTD